MYRADQPKYLYYEYYIHNINEYYISEQHVNESRSESGYFAKALSFYCVIDLDCNKSRSKVKGIVNLVVII